MNLKQINPTGRLRQTSGGRKTFGFPGVAFSLALLLVLVSCETAVEFTGQETAPLLVLESVARPGEPLQASLTASRFFLSQTDTFAVVPGAEVSLYVGGQFRETLAETAPGIYTSAFVPSQGQSLALEISADGFESVLAETSVPDVPADFRWEDSSSLVLPLWEDSGTLLMASDSTWSDVEYRSVDYEMQMVEFSCTFAFGDIPATEFYCLEVLQQADDSTWNASADLSSARLLAGSAYEDLDVYEGRVLFADEFFRDGTARVQLDFDLMETAFYENGERLPDTDGQRISVRVRLLGVSESYYYWQKTLAAFNGEFARGVFSEPVQVYSNIQGGIGIFGGVHQGAEYEFTLTTPWYNPDSRYGREVLLEEDVWY